MNHDKHQHENKDERAPQAGPTILARQASRRLTVDLQAARLKPGSPALTGAGAESCGARIQDERPDAHCPTAQLNSPSAARGSDAQRCGYRISGGVACHVGCGTLSDPHYIFPWGPVPSRIAVTFSPAMMKTRPPSPARRKPLEGANMTAGAEVLPVSLVLAQPARKWTLSQMPRGNSDGAKFRNSRLAGGGFGECFKSAQRSGA